MGKLSKNSVQYLVEYLREGWGNLGKNYIIPERSVGETFMNTWKYIYPCPHPPYDAPLFLAEGSEAKQVVLNSKKSSQFYRIARSILNTLAISISQFLYCAQFFSLSKFEPLCYGFIFLNENYSSISKSPPSLNIAHLVCVQQKRFTNS